MAPTPEPRKVNLEDIRPGDPSDNSARQKWWRRLPRTQRNVLAAGGVLSAVTLAYYLFYANNVPRPTFRKPPSDGGAAGGGDRKYDPEAGSRMGDDTNSRSTNRKDNK